MLTNPKRALAAIAVLLAILAGGIIAVTVDPNDGAPSTPPVTFKVDGLDAGKATDTVVTVPAPVVAATAPKLEDDLQNEAPAAAPVDALQAARDAAAEVAATLAPLPTAGATAGFEGCRTQFVANQSSRRGVRPTMMTLHYTVSPNRPGWADVNAVVALFDRPSSQASSTFVLDAEGNCAFIVPVEQKPWTQAAGNPFSVSWEIIATGRESVYLPPPGLARLRATMLEVSRRTGIPMRRGEVNGCVPVRSGIVEHRDWGVCGGGHVDITPFPIDRVVAQVAGGCDAKCARTRSLRSRNTLTHAELRRRSCAPADRTRSARCVVLHRRHRAVHAAAAREGLGL